MSHNLTLYCGCVVYVACHPHTGVAHTRILEHRHPLCPVRKHEIGFRLALWELLPEANVRTADPLAHGGQFRVARREEQLASTLRADMASRPVATANAAPGRRTRRH
jgi:hypothetical protein